MLISKYKSQSWRCFLEEVSQNSKISVLPMSVINFFEFSSNTSIASVFSSPAGKTLELLNQLFYDSFSGKMYGLRILLWSIGLVNYVGHPQPPQSYWARVYCGCQPGPTRVALHPGRMMEKPERQPYIHWTTCYDFEEMKNIELCSYTPPRPVRLYDMVDPGSTTSSSTVLCAA